MKVPPAERTEFSARGAANVMGRNESEILRLLHDGQIGGWQSEGGLWRVPRHEIEAFQRRMVARHGAEQANL